MVFDKFYLKSGHVKKIEDLGYGWAMYLAKFDNDGHSFHLTILTKDSKIVFVNKFFGFYTVYSSSTGEELTGKITPNQLVKTDGYYLFSLTHIVKGGVYSFAGVPMGYVHHIVPPTVFQKFDKMNYFPDN